MAKPLISCKFKAQLLASYQRKLVDVNPHSYSHLFTFPVPSFLSTCCQGGYMPCACFHCPRESSVSAFSPCFHLSAPCIFFSAFRILSHNVLRDEANLVPRAFCTLHAYNPKTLSQFVIFNP